VSEAIEATGTSAAAEQGSEELLPDVRIRSDSVLRAEHLVKRYGKRRVVDDVSLEVHPGEVVGLLGPNGAGKTTTFYMIVGLIKHSRGKIYLDGEEITHKAMYRRARMGIGYLSQEPSVFRKLTVEDNIRAILETCGLSRRQRKERLETLLDELGLRRVRKTKAYALSGGERRRLEITRALVTQPRYMLLDEPFAGVDPIAVDDLQSIVAALRDRGLGILITDHNVRETLQITDRAYLLYEGRILKSGAAEELIADPEARRLYLGEDFRL
jgi:lipopolysaccharide export system ATP-binding protein